MHNKDHTYFNLLKEKIVAVMQQSFPGINSSMMDWKGQEITDFQEDLRIKVNSHISEKWFYTHMKTSHHSLPRIDMLNLLSRYAGYANWDDFIYQQEPQSAGQPISYSKANRYFILIPFVALIIVGIIFGLFKLFNTREYRITFIDAHTHEPILTKNIEITLLPEGESPLHYLVQSDGCFHLKTDKSMLRMVVKTPYYHTDTIVRIVTKLNTNETVLLNPDEYSMVIHYFSMMKVDDWQKRREHLNEMIDDGAIFYQVIQGKEATGMALFNKHEFIDKLTIPSGSLRNIEILDSRSRNGKIVLLRFMVKENSR